MPVLQPKPNEPYRRGDRQLSAESLNRTVEAVPRQVVGGGDSAVSYYGDRIVVESKSVNPHLPDPGNYFYPFVIVGESDDYLVCVPYVNRTTPDGWSPRPYAPVALQTGDRAYNVAKPYLLQRSPWDGKSVELNGVNYNYGYGGLGLGSRYAYANGSATPVVQSITPSYVAGDIITAVRQVTGVEDVDNAPVLWQDINSAARQWAASNQSGSTASFIGCRLYGDITVLTPSGEGPYYDIGIGAIQRAYWNNTPPTLTGGGLDPMTLQPTFDFGGFISPSSTFVYNLFMPVSGFYQITILASLSPDVATLTTLWVSSNTYYTYGSVGQPDFTPSPPNQIAYVETNIGISESPTKTGTGICYLAKGQYITVFSQGSSRYTQFVLQVAYLGPAPVTQGQ